MAADELIYEKQGHVGVITINRPEARNALTWSTYAALEAAVRETDARCLVITGADPAFCSGDDVKQIMGGGEKPPDLGSREPRLTPAADAILHTDVPSSPPSTVRRSVGGWSWRCTPTSGSRRERAKFGELFVLRGLVTDVGGIGRLTSLVGREKTAELLFTGDVIDAAEALRIGLVGRVVEHDDLLPTALELAQRIAANPPLAVQAIKRGLRLAVDPDWNELGRWVSTNLAELFQTDDHREGVKSFLEKRAPELHRHLTIHSPDPLRASGESVTALR